MRITKKKKKKEKDKYQFKRLCLCSFQNTLLKDTCVAQNLACVMMSNTRCVRQVRFT